jgi:SAM-dependent methyltransferase
MDKLEINLKNVKIYDKTKPYQSVDDVDGIRNTLSRIDLMKLPNDFGGQSVLDIGCNTGMFAIEAKKRNAGYVMGIDYSYGSIGLAKDIANKYNLDVDFRVCNLNHDFAEVVSILGNKKFDIVFALSVWKHIYDINFWTIIKMYCKKTCYFEVNAVHDGRHHSDSLKQFIKKIRYNPSVMCKFLQYKTGAKEVTHLCNTKDDGKRGCYKITMS